MKIQVRQSLYSSIAFGVVFIILSCLIYLLYSQNLRKALYKNLEKTAYITALFYLEEDELNTKEFEKVKKQFEEIVSGTSYQVYNMQGHMVWGNADKKLPNAILKKIQKEKQMSFLSETDFCFAIFYEDNQGDFVIVTQEQKAILHEQLVSLLWILFSALLVGLIAVILLSRWLAHVAYKPFTYIIEQVKGIPPNNPVNQIHSPNTQDELQELTDTFNHLLEQISETFVIQKNFANYVSHEFKTPLASILGNLEVFSLKDRSPKEYEELSLKLISQIHQLEGILNTLIVISDLRENAGLTHQFRIDELVWEIIERISFSYTNSKVNVRIDILPEDESLLIVNQDRMQILMALFNLIENAVKYSRGEEVSIKLVKQQDKLGLSIEDKGMGIPAEELMNISKPFYRADNANTLQGTGIGLSIALRILEKNNIEFKIQSEEDKGTIVLIIL